VLGASSVYTWGMSRQYSDAAQIVGVRIRRIRHGLGLSQEDVANLAEIHVTNYGKIERGAANPSLTTLVRIADALDANPAELVDGIIGAAVPDRTHQLTAADLIRERNRRSR
jgi:transcriptional regulator with XRE-family HTH domain